MRSCGLFCGMLVLLCLPGCSGSRKAVAPIVPAPEAPLVESTPAGPVSIALDPPDAGGVARPESPEAEGSLPEILDVTIDRAVLPMNAYASLTAISNVSLVAHEWHVEGIARPRGASTNAVLPIESKSTIGRYTGWVRGVDPSGRKTPQREFVLDVQSTPLQFFELRVDRTEVAVGDLVTAMIVAEGDLQSRQWSFDDIERELVALPSPRMAQFRAVHPGNATLTVTLSEWRNGVREKFSKSRRVHVAGVPELVQESWGPLYGGSGETASVQWISYGQPSAIEWDLGSAATLIDPDFPYPRFQLHEPGLYLPRVRGMNSYGWSDWTEFPLAIAESWETEPDFASLPQNYDAIGSRVWRADVEATESELPAVRIGYTEALRPLAKDSVWQELELPFAASWVSLEGFLRGCRRPVLQMRTSAGQQLLIPTTAEPQGTEEWVLRTLRLHPDEELERIAGCAQRLAVVTSRSAPLEVRGTWVYDIPMGELIAQETALDLTQSTVQATRIMGAAPRDVVAMPDGIAWVDTFGRGQEQGYLVTSWQAGLRHSYSISVPGMRVPSLDYGQRCIGGRLVLTGQSAEKQLILLRSGATVPRSPIDWEIVETPLPTPNYFSSAMALHALPGSDWLWCSAFAIPSDLPVWSYADPQAWRVIDWFGATRSVVTQERLHVLRSGSEGGYYTLPLE